MLSDFFFSLSSQDRIVLIISLLLASLIAIIIIVFGFSSLYLKSIIKRFIRIQLRKRLIDPSSQSLETGIFASYYRDSICHLQKTSDELLRKILQNNHSCAFFVDRSISFLSTPGQQGGYASIDEFREKVPLTTYDDYRDYIDRIVKNGENNMITCDKIDYFAKSSGTTGQSKLLPMAASTIKPATMVMRVAYSRVLLSLPTSFPSPEQRIFQLRGGKKKESFPKSKGGIPIGSVSLYPSAVPSNFVLKLAASSYDVLSLDLVEDISDFETSTFVQLVFALAVPDIYSYTVNFAPGFIHTIKIIEKYFEEISHCISTANFDHSSLVRDNILDSKLKTKLNRSLDEVTIEYGGFTYRLERAEHIRNECLKKDIPGILHRLWPTLVYAATVLGSSFAMYKNEIEGYCGKRLPLINLPLYFASEAAIGFLASIHTDEYFLSPIHAFFEFIKEEDILQAQPKTLLISEIQPGERYELVITIEGGLVRYRMGDVILCTRFLSREKDFLPLPAEPAEIPRIPLISMAYRIGSLLNVFGEKTTEEHLLHALKQTIHDWKEKGINVELCDYTSFPKLDAFPIHYVIFYELIDDEEHKINDQERQIIQNTLDSEAEQHLSKVNSLYYEMRAARKLDPVECILVRSGTFSSFTQKIFKTNGISPIQVKSPRLLKDKDHIRFFYDNQIDTSKQ